ncbi:hypothetical protein G6F31_014573 [Rhizopus arrhizus]|nr:hypothetical protein G6F31_014573 [Rhizopus arrhizus]
MKSIPVGTAYAIWTGIGAMGVAVLGIYLFNDSASPARLACVGLICRPLAGNHAIWRKWAGAGATDTSDSPVRDPESNALEFVAGCAVDADIYYLAARIGPGHECYDPDPGPPSRMFFYQHQTDEKWFYHDLSDWQVESAIFIPEQQDGRERRVLALDFYGHLEDLARSGTKCELIPPEGDHFCGGLTRVRQLGKDLFCCGVHGMICHRSETGWKQLPTHFPAPERGSLKDDLESIDFDNWLACSATLSFGEDLKNHAPIWRKSARIKWSSSYSLSWIWPA